MNFLVLPIYKKLSELTKSLKLSIQLKNRAFEHQQPVF